MVEDIATLSLAQNIEATLAVIVTMAMAGEAVFAKCCRNLLH